MLATAARVRGTRRRASAQSERPATSSTIGRTAASLIAHPRIDERVDHVDEEVEGEDENGDEHDGPHDEGVAAVQGSLDEVAPDARQAEDRLDHDRAGEERGCRRAEIG